MARLTTALLSLALMASFAQAQEKPNILIIWGDDIGWNNPSCYNRGMMGYRTPNIDRIASEGALFTDWYGQQSCTAGRAAFITGQSPFRTGLLKVGLGRWPLSASDVAAVCRVAQPQWCWRSAAGVLPKCWRQRRTKWEGSRRPTRRPISAAVSRRIAGLRSMR